MLGFDTGEIFRSGENASEEVDWPKDHCVYPTEKFLRKMLNVKPEQLVTAGRRVAGMADEDLMRVE